MNFVRIVRSRASCFLLFSTLLTQGAAALAEAPVPFWHSQPVKPDETVMVQGHAVGTSTQVDVQRLEDGYPGQPQTPSSLALTSPVRIAPLSFGESLLNFVIPANWPQGVFAYRLVNDQPSSIKLINAPEPWFIHGDQGSRSTPGGWVAVYGNSLKVDSAFTPQLALIKNGVTVVIPASTSTRTGATTETANGNAYAQYFNLPSTLETGDYEVYVHNGMGGNAAWTRLQPNETANSDKLRVVSVGSLWETVARAQPEIEINPASNNSGALTWDQVFQSAFTAIKNRNGSGGVVRVKPGVYTFSNYFVLPDHIILAGDYGQRGNTTLQWGEDATPHTVGWRNPLLIGETLDVWPLKRGTFSVEDLTLTRTSSNRVGGCIERAYTNTAEQSAGFRRIACREPNTAEVAYSAVQNNGTNNWTHNRSSLWMRSTFNTEITDSVFDTIASITLAGQDSANVFVRVENNAFHWRLAPLNVLYGLKNLIYAGNTELMLGTETANGTGAWADVGNSIGSFAHNNRDIYFSQNKMQREGNDAPYIHQGLTLDGNAGVYFGKITSVSGTHVNLAGITSIAEPGTNRKRAQYGALVQILTGKGAGQWRHLISPVLDSNNQGVSAIDIDAPWEVEPDANSWISINDFQGRMVFYGNDLANAPKFQLYYPSHDAIVAENILSPYQTAAIPVWTGYRGGGYGSMTRAWHTQVINNTHAGSLPITIPIVITSLNTGETLQPQWGSYPGYDGSYLSTQVIRNNQNNGSTSFGVSPGDQNGGSLIEGNQGMSFSLFKEPPLAPVTVLFRNNTSPEDNRPQLHEPSGNRFPTNPGLGISFSYTTGDIVNLARSGMASAVNDFGGYGRIKPIDGDTRSNWALSGGLADSGLANQAWLEVDTRTQDVIQSIKIWPRLEATNPGVDTADVWVLVSPTPFASGDLNTEKSRPGVYSQFLAGRFTGVRIVDMPVSPSPFIGRYIRAWKSFPVGQTGRVQLAEIEAFGYGALDLAVTLSADTSTAAQGETVNYTVTVFNHGSHPAMNVTATGTLADCSFGTINSQASASCTRSAVTDTVGLHSQTMTASTTDAEPAGFLGNNTATTAINVRGVLNASKTGTGSGTVNSTPEGINCGADCTEPYDANTVVTLTATADANSVFGSWSGCDTASGTSCTVNINASRSVTASFAPASQPDLVHLALTASRSGANLVIRDRIKNQGAALANASTISYYLSLDTAYQSGTDILICSRPLAALTAGVSIPAGTGTTSTTCPTPAVPYGTTYRVLAVDDSGNVVAESNESNNLFVSTSAALSLGANLTPPSGAVTASKSGGTLTLGDRVFNSGSAPAGSFKVGFYVSTNTSFGTSDVFICSRTVNSLGVSQSDPVSETTPTTCTAPVMPAGNYYVLAVDDYENAVSESSETNNTRATANKLSW